MGVLNEIRSMFWGVTLDGGKRYTQTVERSFHISMAALEPPSTEGLSGKLSPVSLMVNIDKAEFLLCTLGYGNILQQPLDLMFTEGEEVTFFLNGSGIVHLSGYLVEDQPEDESMYPDDISSEDEDSEDIPALLGEDSDDNSDDDEDDDTIRKALFKHSKKRKLKDKAEKSKKKVKVAAEEEEDSDDEDDDDFEIHDFDEDDSDDDTMELGQLANLDDESFDDDSEEEEVQNTSKSASSKKQKKSAKESKQQTNKQEQKKKNKQQTKEEKNKEAVSSNKDLKLTDSTAKSEDSTDGKKKKKKKKKNKANVDTEQKSEPEKPRQQATPKKRVLAGGTLAEELKIGHGPEASSGKMVSVYYVGTLSSNGKQFDSCKQGKPFRFRLGKNEVIKGWDTGVAGMKVGGKRRLTVPPQQGYGGQRQGPIPGNSTLVFDVELKAVN